MANRLTRILTYLAISCMTLTALADDAELAKAVAAAKGNFAAVTDEGLAAAKGRLATALGELESHLATLPADESNTWRESLALDGLAAAMNGEASDMPALRASAAKLSENKEGLENAKFMAVRDALLVYERALLVKGNANSKALYQQQVEGLGKALQTYSTSPSVDTGVPIGVTLGNLELAGQAPNLVSAVRKRFRRPNLRANISERLAAAGLSQPVDRTQVVNEVILGTVTNGTAHLTGATKLKLKPNENKAELEITLNGVARSTNVGVNRGVTIYSQGHTTLDGGALISIDENGVTTHPAWATAATGTTVTGLWHKSCLIRKIAWNRVGEQKAKAEVIASQRAANRLAAELNKEADETVGKMNDNYLDKFRFPLLRKRQFPSVMKLQTTDDAVSLVMTQAGAYQLAAPSDFPKPDEDLDLSVQLHESFIGNMTQGLFGGETLTSENLSETIKDLTGEVPEGLSDDDEPPWSITFSNVTPIRVYFEDELIRVSIRGRRFTRGDSVVTSEMEIATAYKIERTDKGAKLVRQGEVTAEYTEKGFQNPEKIAIKTVMRKKFTALFSESRELDGLQLPGRFESIGKLQVTQLDCGKQWLALGWTMPKSAGQNVSQTNGDQKAQTTAAEIAAEE